MQIHFASLLTVTPAKTTIQQLLPEGNYGKSQRTQVTTLLKYAHKLNNQKDWAKNENSKFKMK